MRTRLTYRLPRSGLGFKGESFTRLLELIRAMCSPSCAYVQSAADSHDEFVMAAGFHQATADLLIINDLTMGTQEEAPWCRLFLNYVVLIDEDGNKNWRILA